MNSKEQAGLLLEPADIMCSQSQKLFGQGIRLFTTHLGEKRSKVNHTGVIAGAGTFETAPLVEALVKVQMHSIMSQYGPPDTDKIVIFRPRIFPSEKEIIAKKALSYVGKKYGYAKLLTHTLDWCLGGVYLFRRMNHADNYPICSWITEHAYNEIGWDFGVPLGGTNPDDIWDWCSTHIERFECLFPLQRLQI